MGRIWVLVGNAGGVRIFGGRSEDDLAVIGELDNSIARTAPNVRRMGRRGPVLGAAESALDRFVEHLDALLAEAHGAGRFDNLVVVGPSDFTNVLQRRLDRRVAATISAFVTRESIPATSDALLTVARESLHAATPAPA